MAGAVGSEIRPAGSWCVFLYSLNFHRGTAEIQVSVNAKVAIGKRGLLGLGGNGLLGLGGKPHTDNYFADGLPCFRNGQEGILHETVCAVVSVEFSAIQRRQTLTCSWMSSSAVRTMLPIRGTLTNTTPTRRHAGSISNEDGFTTVIAATWSVRHPSFAIASTILISRSMRCEYQDRQTVLP